MNISNVGYSQHSYIRPTSTTQEGKIAQAKAVEDTKQPYLKITNDISESKAVNKTTKAEGEVPSSGVEAFTYGALGLDHPDEVKEKGNDAYSAGQMLSAIGTIGSILAILV